MRNSLRTGGHTTNARKVQQGAECHGFSSAVSIPQDKTVRGVAHRCCSHEVICLFIRLGLSLLLGVLMCSATPVLLHADALCIHQVDRSRCSRARGEACRVGHDASRRRSEHSTRCDMCSRSCRRCHLGPSCCGSLGHQALDFFHCLAGSQARSLSREGQHGKIGTSKPFVLRPAVHKAAGTTDAL